mmetsp:Transcript_1355/g.1881  ORF Transcript_1355/g.1881 Transcript_1355/m.1881 type:complete len:217 (+) Transcript_1355:120-770(+)|eukprot:CAMPEP_0201691810 /NCGR_PEP_ID=MMETSP0578-20130828/4864_1 /ASSEMBLY_ACC=CAM_ASM_000663 /TAXON_ID=267565 /ORGANISM="Skeletonema grethea, Strain CCMP 1804" /LENGTH=216 /DNA_ID=CAMNT_0048177073 /DNA_START=84 /DNA_END=734 /DNA_ORIENTATION=+
MGLTQTKLHFAIIRGTLEGEWYYSVRRVEKAPYEATIANPCGDYPLHLACYSGNAPPSLIRALIDAYPDALLKNNNKGRDPLELAAKNYSFADPKRAQVLALLRWHRPGNSSTAIAQQHSGDLQCNSNNIFCDEPPEHMYSCSAQCVVCLEEVATIAMKPCGHICLCLACVPTTMKSGLCPVDRCEVRELYQLQGDQINIHMSMCGSDLPQNVPVS